MWKTVIKGAVIGGIIVFVWGMISWGLLPWHRMNMHHFSNGSRVADVIQNNTMEDGIYVYSSHMHHTSHCGECKSSDGSGPFIFAAVSKNGINMKGTHLLVRGLIVNIIAAFFVTWMLYRTKSHPYWHKVGFFVLAALFAGFAVNFPHWNWMGFPFSYALVSVVDLVIGWFLAGLAVAKIVRK